MRRRWAGYLLVPFLIILLLPLAKTFPYTKRTDSLLNRILPLGGFILGAEPEAWVGDTKAHQRIAGKGRQNRPRGVDVDFIKVKGEWYKVKGPVYITKGGTLIGWHQDIKHKEPEYLGKWLFRFLSEEESRP